MQTEQYCKLISFSKDNYYIITQKEIKFYNKTKKTTEIVKTFEGDQIITSQEVLKMISYGSFFQNLNLVSIKHYLYALSDSGYIHCIKKLTEIEYYYSSLIIPIKCSNQKCYFVIGLINSDKKLTLDLYGNIEYSCESVFCHNIYIDGDSDNLSCDKITSSGNDQLICFYEKYNSNEIVASYINVDINNEKLEIISSKSQSNNGGKIIKSISSQDGSKYFVCNINNDNNCNCLIYDKK